MTERINAPGFLPVCREEMEASGTGQPDFVYVIGDAYVDHPSFGYAVISRVLEARGYTVGMIPQPDYRDADSIAVFGEPRLGFLVSAGNMDSIIMCQTAQRRLDPADDDGRVFVCPADQIAVYDRGPVRPPARRAARTVTVRMPAFFRRRIMVDHGIHVAGGHQTTGQILCAGRSFWRAGPT